MRRVGLLAFALTVMYAGLGLADESTVYGDGVTVEQAVAIETLLTEPEEYVGKTIRVDGVVTDVCKTRGCWIEITDPDSGEGVRVKVQDGVISFPASSLGHKASAQGVFQAIKLTPEQLAEVKKGQHAHTGCAKHQEHQEHHAAEGKKEGCPKARAAAEAKAAAAAAEEKAADEKSDEKKSDCVPKVHGDTIFLIRGTGAVINA